MFKQQSLWHKMEKFFFNKKVHKHNFVVLFMTNVKRKEKGWLIS